MPEFSTNKVILHRFHVDNNEGESDVGSNMIIFRDLMVQLGLLDDVKHQLLQQNGFYVPMKETIGLIEQIDLISQEMCKMVMQNAEPISTMEDTDRTVKNIDSTYVKSDFEQVASNKTRLNADERTQLIGLLK